MRLKKEDSVGVVYLLKRAELAVRSCAETALAPFGLTPAQFLILFRVKESKDVSSADLARTLVVRPQSIVDLIRPLERRGLIKRREDPGRRRILRITLSAAGEQLLARSVPVARQLERELLSNLSESHVAQLQAGLTELLTSAQAHDTHRVARRSAAAPRRTAAPAKRAQRKARGQ